MALLAFIGEWALFSWQSLQDGNWALGLLPGLQSLRADVSVKAWAAL